MVVIYCKERHRDSSLLYYLNLCNAYEGIYIVEASTKYPSHGDDFDHKVEHAMSCTLEEDVDVLSCDNLWFGSLYKVIDVEQIRCIGQSKGGFDQGMMRFHGGIGPCLKRAKPWGKGCSNKATKISSQTVP